MAITSHDVSASTLEVVSDSSLEPPGSKERYLLQAKVRSKAAKHSHQQRNEYIQAALPEPASQSGSVSTIPRHYRTQVSPRSFTTRGRNLSTNFMSQNVAHSDMGPCFHEQVASREGDSSQVSVSSPNATNQAVLQHERRLKCRIPRCPTQQSDPVGSTQVCLTRGAQHYLPFCK